MNLDEFLEHLHLFIVDIYAQELRGNRLSPDSMWKKGIKEGFNPAIPSSKLDWRVALMKIGDGTIQNTGIRRDHLYYQSDGLRDLKVRLNLKGMGIKVRYKYDPSDISKIYVYDELRMEYIEAFCTDQEYSSNLNEYSHKSFVEAAREGRNIHVKISQIAAAKAKSEELIKKGVLSKKERQQLARMQGGSEKVFANKANALDKEKTKIESEEIVLKTNEKPELPVNKTEHSEYEEIDFDQDWGVMDYDS
ncbi:Mu transposase C-terminal domain-containing protein [Lysinibacillus xylanilyticus]|uniref:Mu transposase C-terminal domain-containing protein n=1 Tax=Lysinibacillus xylanilyticus TaxID=582475 RepID=A0ABV3VYG3_9BACI